MEIIPEYLYKYKSFDNNGYWYDIFEHKRLYMANPAKFNDPFEGRLFPFETGSCGNTIHINAGKANKDVAQFLHSYRVLCLSGNIRNKAMWAYYADNYQGFAIQFRTEKGADWPAKKNHFSKAKRVIYKSDNESIPCRHVRGYEKAKELQRLCLLYKSADWKQEEEFRIIRYDRTHKSKFFHFEYSDIESVILGAKINDKNRKLITELCKNNQIKVRNMWLATIDSRIEFFSGKSPRFDGSDYKDFIDRDI